MKFLVVSFAPLLNIKDRLHSYAPYVKEMNIWFRHCDEVGFCSPTFFAGKNLLLAPFDTSDFTVFEVPTFTQRSILIKPWLLVTLFISLFKAMRWADHIHLRCPGNLGVLGVLVQVLFPQKQKTAKYAGNWDWASRQPWSYRLQQLILRNTFLTKNMQALVYGDWSDRTANIKPFFTASYSENDKLEVSKFDISDRINLVFVGALSENKRPLIALEVLNALIKDGYTARLVYCGDGPELVKLFAYANRHGLGEYVDFFGNVPSNIVMEEFIKAHFLVFASKSEGWPKAVAEAMWWGCIPITTTVSCVPQMVGHGSRGVLVEPDVRQITNVVIQLFEDDQKRIDMMDRAMVWSRQYTLERFEREIIELIRY